MSYIERHLPTYKTYTIHIATIDVHKALQYQQSKK